MVHIAEFSDYWFAVRSHAERVAVDKGSHLSNCSSVGQLSLPNQILREFESSEHFFEVPIEVVEPTRQRGSEASLEPFWEEFIIFQSISPPCVDNRRGSYASFPRIQ